MDNIRLGLFAMRKTYCNGTINQPDNSASDQSLENFLLERGPEFGLYIGNVMQFRVILEDIDGYERQLWRVHRRVQNDTGRGVCWLEDADARDPWVIQKY
ncbi:hypothetical protein FRX31_029404 [Thalictrum thalictroides]|uniref:Uncharacterized protein n=1 Tax=Thalictrum thalictroides TaxID=46969 RepID=A0A7J6V7C1_THATH|nr:hypothetical protein FRX31_029404 [Thalictrum thalictroides]